MPTKRKSATRYSCPKEGAPYSLEELIQAMQDDPALAAFIKEMLCQIHSGSQAEKRDALKCLDSYCTITEDDLKALCIPKVQRNAILDCRCTDTNNPTKAFLLDIPAYVTANLSEKSARRKRVSKRVR